MSVDMVVTFGYCCFCDNGPDKQERGWVKDLLNSRATKSHIMGHCVGCEKPENKNLLMLAVSIPDRIS